MGGRDHGGGLDAAIAQYGGPREAWIDLSTGINPVPYPVPTISQTAWGTLPDAKARQDLLDAARRFWGVPDHLNILAAPGCSSLIAQIPRLARAGGVQIQGPTYNEHAAAFGAAGWRVGSAGQDAAVIVHPNNPTGAWHAAVPDTPLTIIDESFCDVRPDLSLLPQAGLNTLTLKSFGKFWGLAGLRLGFAIGPPKLIAKLQDMLGPWPVSGPALEVGKTALSDTGWAQQTRTRLAADAQKLDSLMAPHALETIGTVSLFRLYRVSNAQAFQDHLARHRIWSRIFPYSDTWIRLGLPPAQGWDMLRAAL